MTSAALLFSLPLFAQVSGPIQPPPATPPAPVTPQPARPKAPGEPAPQPKSPPAKQPPTAARHVTYPITHKPPSVPVDQIIRQFAAHEAEFKVERDNFTYVQTFLVQTIDSDGFPDGEYRLTSDITFTPDGKRYEKITDAPQPTLTRVSLTQEDLDDLRNIQPFVLTTTELPQYNVTYVGQQRVDELHTYVFDVAPKKIEKNHRYFQGRVWVDDKDLEIVMTDGKAVPNIGKGDSQNMFPRFKTYRENIEGHYWFPTYTYADDVLHFDSGDVHIREVVRYTNYKRFRVSIKLINPNKSDQPQPNPPNPPNQPKPPNP